MRMLFVIITGLTLMFMITTFWYVGQAMIVSIGSAIVGTLTGDAFGTMRLLEYASIIWGPLLDIFVVVWMIAAAQQRDVESERY